jgi:hypothetical protein
MRIWSKADVQEGVDYQLELCQDDARARFFRLLPYGTPRSTDVESVAITKRIEQRELLARRDLLGLCERTQLENGERYFVDAHGVWFLKPEREALLAGEAVPWVTSEPPALPDR